MKRNLIITTILCMLFVTFLLVNGEDKTEFIQNSKNHPEVIHVEQMIDKTGAVVEPDLKRKIALAIVENANYYGIKPKNLVAIAFVESNFRPHVINNSGDHGLMQINWPTWKNKFTRNKKDLLDIDKNIETACRIINININSGFTDLASYHSLNEDIKAEYAANLRNVLKRI